MRLAVTQGHSWRQKISSISKSHESTYMWHATCYTITHRGQPLVVSVVTFLLSPSAWPPFKQALWVNNCSSPSQRQGLFHPYHYPTKVGVGPFSKMRKLRVRSQVSVTPKHTLKRTHNQCSHSPFLVAKTWNRGTCRRPHLGVSAPCSGPAAPSVLAQTPVHRVTRLQHSQDHGDSAVPWKCRGEVFHLSCFEKLSFNLK